MDKRFIFPIILIILQLGAAVVCGWAKDFKMMIYWIAGAVINTCATF